MPKRIVLVHGAWSSAKSWGAMARILARRGYDVAAVDLPGHGSDPTPPETVQLADYSAKIVDVLSKGPPAVLVGHSMGGMAISAAAEQAPEHIRKLAYVCAFLPQSGDSLLSLIKRDGHTVSAAVRPGPVAGTTVLEGDVAIPYLAQDASPRMQQEIIAHMGLQPNAPQTDIITLSGNFQSVPRTYVFCENDRTISPTLQRWMVARSPCAQTHTLETGHLPQMTAVPQMAEILESL